MPEPRSFEPKHLVVVAIAEGLAMITAVLRMAFSQGAIHLDKQAHLAWFVFTTFVAGSSVGLFVLRSQQLYAKERAGEDVAEARTQVMALSVVVALGALGLAAVGPMPFEKLLP